MQTELAPSFRCEEAIQTRTAETAAGDDAPPGYGELVFQSSYESRQAYRLPLLNRALSSTGSNYHFKRFRQLKKLFRLTRYIKMIALQRMRGGSSDYGRRTSSARILEESRRRLTHSTRPGSCSICYLQHGCLSSAYFDY